MIASTLLIGHRGSPDDAPENTVASARLAWERGADAVELDVRLTRDGRLIVFHDGHTRRITGVPGVPEDMTFDALRRLDAGRWKDLRFGGERIPTLEEVLATAGTGRRFFIEVKRGPEVVPALRDALERAEPGGPQVTLMSFHLETVRAAKAVMPQYPVCWLLPHPRPGSAIDRKIETARRAGLDGLNVSQKWPVDDAFVQKVKAAGLWMGVWTVDDPAEGRRLIEAGVDGLTTNRCGPLRRELGF